ncbi:MAG: lipid II flippase MurJ [Candidatus Omnitrophica bacterium]|nr:lipid II flippase MurJ [Candidatus Omnitrophota bacterium]
MFFKALVNAFGVSVIVQLFGLARQIFIATNFGASRELDVYFMAFTAANLLVFGFAVIFDTVGIPHLVKCKEEQGDAVFRKFAGSIFTFSLIFSCFLGVLFVLAMPIIIHFMAAGFSASDKGKVYQISFYFLPWILFFLPYLALCSFYKSIRLFNIVFFGEFIISAVSLFSILLFHNNTTAIPLAYFAGYLSGFILLFVNAFRHFDLFGKITTIEMRHFYRNFSQLFGTNQISSLYLIVERFMQSFLPQGGVTVLSYSAQLTTNVSGLLTFRDIFMVPLALKNSRNARLERVIIGLSMIAIPVMSFIFFCAQDIITVFFRYGKFDTASGDLLAASLSVYALSILPGVVGVPAFRMFQVIDKIKNTAMVYACNIVCLLVFGSLFIYIFKLGVLGFAYSLLAMSYISIFITFYLLFCSDVKINYLRALKFIAYFLGVCFFAGYITSIIPPITLNKYVFLAIKLFTYFLCVGVCYLPIKDKLKGIIGYAGL